jgi:hypothetical protein
MSSSNNSSFAALLARGKQTGNSAASEGRPDLKTTSSSSTSANDDSGSDNSRSPFNPNRGGSRGRPMMIPKPSSSGRPHRKQVSVARSAPLMSHMMPPAAPIRKPSIASFEPPSLALPPSPQVENMIPSNPLDNSDSSISPVLKVVSRSLRQDNMISQAIAFSAPTFGFMNLDEGDSSSNKFERELFSEDEGNDTMQSLNSSRRASLQSPIISLLETNSFSQRNSSSFLHGGHSSLNNSVNMSTSINSQMGISLLPPRPTPSSVSSVPSVMTGLSTPTSGLTLALQGRGGQSGGPKPSPIRSRQQLAQMVRDEQRRGSHMDMYDDSKTANQPQDDDELQFAISMDDRELDMGGNGGGGGGYF